MMSTEVIFILSYLTIALIIKQFPVYSCLSKYMAFELFESSLCQNCLYWPLVVIALVAIFVLYLFVLIYAFVMDFKIEHGYY